MAPLIDIPVEKYHLKNGLTVLLNPNPKASLVAYYWGIPVGSRHEKEGITGISHMFEHLMFRGTRKYPNMDNLYDNQGIVRVNAHTSYDFTGYMGQFPPSKLELVLDVESDRIAHLILNNEVLEKERKAVQEERYLTIENNPRGFLFESLMSLVFKEHPYKWHIIGYKEDIASYKLEDLKKWYKTYYSPNNIVLVLSGSFSKKKAKKQIEKYFSFLPAQELPALSYKKEPKQIAPRHLTIKKPVQTKEIRLAYIGPPEDSQELLALEAIALILGGGESSRLYKKIVREKKLLPDISAGVMDLVDYSVFLVSFALPQGTSESFIKSLVLEEIQNVSIHPVVQRELEKVSHIFLNNQVGQLKRSSYRAFQLAYYEMQYRDYNKLFKRLKAVQSLSPDFIQSVAKRYLGAKKLSYVKLEPH